MSGKAPDRRKSQTVSRRAIFSVISGGEIQTLICMLFGTASPPSGYNHRTSVASMTSPPPTKASSLNSGTAADRNTRGPIGCANKHARTLPNFIGIVSFSFPDSHSGAASQTGTDFQRPLFFGTQVPLPPPASGPAPHSFRASHSHADAHGFTRHITCFFPFVSVSRPRSPRKSKVPSAEWPVERPVWRASTIA